jgi:ABC-type sugar transport system permease subunit
MVGYGSAIAVAVFLLSLTLSLIYIRLLGSRLIGEDRRL